MNNTRRAELRKAIDMLEEAGAIIAAVQMEEQEARDNLPDSLQDGDQGERMQEIADTLDEVAGEVEELADRITEAIS